MNVGAAATTPSVNTVTAAGGGDPLCTGTAPACTASVSTPILDAVNDTVTKQPNVVTTTDVTGNDKYPPGSSFTQTATTCSPAGTMSTSGVASYTSPGPNASCTVTYQVCAPLPNNTVCDIAVLQINSSVAPSLAVSKSVSQSPLIVGKTGQSYTVSIVVSNGPTTAAIALTDNLPPGITLSGTPTSTGGTLSGCPASGNNLTGCSIASPVPNGTIQVTVPVNVAPSTANGNNTANVSGGGDPLCTPAAPCPASVTVAVTDTFAINDTYTGINGALGNSSVGNALVNDTVSGSPATVGPSGNATLSVNTPASPVPGAPVGAPVPVMDPATGIISVPSGTPAGTYTISYKLCEAAVPLNCKDATITVVVTGAPIIATPDPMSVPNGATGSPNAGNVLTNDTVNGITPPTVGPTGNATLAVTTPASPLPTAPPGNTNVPVLDPVTGQVSVPPGTPAGVYPIIYQLCEKLNPTNCATTTATVTVGAAPIDAVNDVLPSVNGATGNPSAGSAFTGDTLNAAAATPATTNLAVTGTTFNGNPATGTMPTLNTATGVVSVPPGTPAGNYDISYTLCEKLNPTNCDTATITVPVAAAAIVGNDDTYTGIISAVGNATAGNVLSNDTLNGVPATTTTTQISGVGAAAPVVPGALVPVLTAATGNVNVPAGTPAGTYTIPYTICETLNPTNCDTTNTVTVTVLPTPIVANNDNFNGGTSLAPNTNPGNVLTNDTINGQPATTANSTVTPGATTFNGGAPGPIVPTLGTDGAVTVQPGTPAGVYVIAYTLCEKDMSPANCTTATATITVGTTMIVAQDDSFPAVVGALGNSNVGNAMAGNGNGPDTLGAAQAVLGAAPGEVTMTVTAPATPVVGAPVGAPVPVVNPTTGVISVPAGTPAGTYTIKYNLCENANPTNCDPATITVVVTGSSILAVNDPNIGGTSPATSTINGTNGANNVANVLTNDTVNGIPAPTVGASGNVTLTATPVSPLPSAPVGNTNVPSIDPATGQVSVPPNTPSGTYILPYTICEKLNPTNCSSATATVNVGAAPIDAVNDVLPSVNGATGNPSAGSAFTGDTLNAAAATPATTNLAVTGTTFNGNPATGTMPTLNTTTGVVSVPAGTPAGNYVITYTLCEKLNPSNCDTATITAPVAAAPIAATPDTYTAVSGTGNLTAGSVLVNDTLNGVPATEATTDFTSIGVATPVSGAAPGAPLPSIEPNGNVKIPAGTPAGTYTIPYTICEKLNTSNCSNNSHNYSHAPPIVANNDNGSMVWWQILILVMQ